MLIRSWFRLVSQCVYRVTRYRRVRPNRLRKRRQRMPLVHAEVLEVRLMLSSSLVYDAVTSSALTLRQSGGELQIVDSANPSTVLAHETAGYVTDGVQIHGNQSDVILTVESSVAHVTGGI